MNKYPRAVSVRLHSAYFAIAGSSPALLVENHVAEAKEYATSEVNAEGLWKLSEKLVGQKFDP